MNNVKVVYVLISLMFAICSCTTKEQNGSENNDQKKDKLIQYDSANKNLNNEYVYCDDVVFLGDSSLYNDINKCKKKALHFVGNFDTISQKVSLYFIHKDSCILLYETTNKLIQKTRIVLLKMVHLRPSELGTEFGEDAEGNAFVVENYLYEKGNYWIEVSCDTENRYLFIHTANNSLTDRRKLFCDVLPGSTLGNLVNIEIGK